MKYYGQYIMWHNMSKVFIYFFLFTQARQVLGLTLLVLLQFYYSFYYFITYYDYYSSYDVAHITIILLVLWHNMSDVYIYKFRFTQARQVLDPTLLVLLRFYYSYYYYITYSDYYYPDDYDYITIISLVSWHNTSVQIVQISSFSSRRTTYSFQTFWKSRLKKRCTHQYSRSIFLLLFLLLLLLIVLLLLLLYFPPNTGWHLLTPASNLAWQSHCPALQMRDLATPTIAPQ